MRRVRPAPAAVLLQLQPLARVALALRGDVVPPLAVLASKRQRRSFIRSHGKSRFARAVGCRLSAVGSVPIAES